jgi:hypothetical protein
MIAVEVCKVAVVNGGRVVVCEDMTGISGDPLTGAARSVRPRRRAPRWQHSSIAGIDQHGSAIGKNQQGGIASPRVDLMDIQSAGRPMREGSSDLLSTDWNWKEKQNGREHPHSEVSLSRHRTEIRFIPERLVRMLPNPAGSDSLAQSIFPEEGR